MYPCTIIDSRSSPCILTWQSSNLLDSLLQLLSLLMTFLRVYKRREEGKSIQFSMAAVVTAEFPTCTINRAVYNIQVFHILTWQSSNLLDSILIYLTCLSLLMTFLRVYKRRGEGKSVQFSMAAVVTAEFPTCTINRAVYNIHILTWQSLIVRIYILLH